MKKIQAKINYKKTEELRALIWNKAFSIRTKLQRTDLVHCLLKIFCRELGISGKPGEQTVESWIIGEIGHVLLEKFFDKQEFETFGPDGLSDVPAHIDGIWQGKGTEIKTTIHSIFSYSQIEPYLEDIGSGFLFLDKDNVNGYLVTLSLIDKILLVWDIHMDSESASELLIELNFRKVLVTKAVATKNFEMLEPKLDECPYCQYNWISGMEVGCPYSNRKV